MWSKFSKLTFPTTIGGRFVAWDPHRELPVQGEFPQHQGRYIFDSGWNKSAIAPRTVASKNSASSGASGHKRKPENVVVNISTKAPRRTISSQASNPTRPESPGDDNGQIAPPWGVHQVNSAVGQSAHEIFKLGKWTKAGKPQIPTQFQTLQLAAIDKIRQDIRTVSNDPSKRQFNVRHSLGSGGSEGRPEIRCKGMEVRKVDQTSKTIDEIKRESIEYEAPGLFHMFLESREAALAPWFYGLPWVTIAIFEPGDIVFTVNDRPITVVERKRDDDACGGLYGRAPTQRDDLARIDLPAHRVRYLREWNNPANNTRKPDELESFFSDMRTRQGFVIERTNGLLETVLTLFSQVYSLLQYGSRYWRIVNRSAGQGPIGPPVRTTPPGKLSCPTDLENGRDSKPSPQNMLPVALGWVPQCTYWTGLNIAKEYSSIDKMVAALRQNPCALASIQRGTKPSHVPKAKTAKPRSVGNKLSETIADFFLG